MWAGVQYTQVGNIVRTYEGISKKIQNLLNTIIKETFVIYSQTKVADKCFEIPVAIGRCPTPNIEDGKLLP